MSVLIFIAISGSNRWLRGRAIHHLHFRNTFLWSGREDGAGFLNWGDPDLVSLHFVAHERAHVEVLTAVNLAVNFA